MSAQTKTFENPQNTPEWERERRKYMGSSDAPAALGLSRYRNPMEVALDKKTARTSNRHPEPETPEMRRGHVLEPVVAALYEKQTGRTLAECESVVHPEHPWMAASPDRRIVQAMAEDVYGLVECKTHSAYIRNQYGEAGTDEVSEYEIIQVQHQMAVTGADYVDVAVLFGAPEALQILSDMVDGGGVSLDFAVKVAAQMEFVVYRVMRDEEFIKTLIEAEEEFWNRYVLGDEMPLNLKSITPRPNSIRPATEEESAAAHDMRKAWLQRERAEAIFEELKAKLQDGIAEAEGIDTSEGVITWKKNKDSAKEVIDWERIALSVCENYKVDGQDLHDLIKANSKTETKPGARVFRTPAAWKKDL